MSEEGVVGAGGVEMAGIVSQEDIVAGCVEITGTISKEGVFYTFNIGVAGISPYECVAGASNI